MNQATAHKRTFPSIVLAAVMVAILVAAASMYMTSRRDSIGDSDPLAAGQFCGRGHERHHVGGHHAEHHSRRGNGHGNGQGHHTRHHHAAHHNDCPDPSPSASPSASVTPPRPTPSCTTTGGGYGQPPAQTICTTPTP